MLNLFHNLASRKICSILIRSIRLSRPSYETHYDVLKLPRNCTTKEIRDSFIMLSKEYHPDKNAKDPDRHKQFIKLNEAYTVLSRPASRREYDLSLVPVRQGVQRMHSHTHFGNTRKAFYDSSFYENRDKSKDAPNRSKPYYGIKGIKKVPNLWIVMFCVAFAAVGVSLQVYLIRESASFNRRVLDEQSSRNAAIYSDVRRKAMEEGEDALLDRMRANEELFKQFRRKKD